MSTTQGFKCICCGKTHEKQAFISHSQKDVAIKQKLMKACCEVGVATFLYECSPEHKSNASPAEVISLEIAKSEMFFILLGDSISKAYWTQAWIGYETGTFKALKDFYQAQKYVIVLQDIRQGIKVCVPTLESLFLFDFYSEAGWDRFKDLVIVLGKLEQFYQAASGFRTAALNANVKCDNCKSGYEAWIAKRDVCKLEKGLNKFKVGPQWIYECMIKCPSCGKMVTRCFTSML